jgi:hypothetical protein
MKHFLIIALASYLVSACSTTVTINSKPDGVKIFADGKEIGKTPITIDSSTITNRNANGMMVRMVQPGYKPLWLWVPTGANDFDININLTPFYLRRGGSSLIDDHEISRTDLNKLTDQMLTLQSALILGKDHDENQLNQLVEANPTLGTAHFFAAISKIRKSDNPSGLVHLRDAMRFAPNELDFLVLYNELGGQGTVEK